MSLTIALNVAKLSINQAESKIAITASNISNADRAGYTRKVLQSNFQSTGDVSIPFGGVAVQAYVDPLLARQVSQQATGAAYEKSMAEYLSRYSQAYGSTADGSANLSSNLDNLLASMQILEANPTDGSAKSKVIATAQVMTSTMNQLTVAIQRERLRANNDIALTVEGINVSLQKISDLNKQIATANATATSSADLEDQRMVEIQSLSQQIGIQYFTDANSQVQIYTLNGTTLVGGTGHASITYAPSGGVSASTIYPGGFSPINLGATDITTTTDTGRLGALITLRDKTLVGEQEKLDAFASGMMQTVNAALSMGAAYPPPNTMTGTVAMTMGTSLAGATGTFRVAVTDQSGFVQAFADIDMTTVATVGDLITALNGIAGINASLDADGYLVVDATNPAHGIAMNPMTSTVGTMNTVQYFGFNNLFVNKGVTAGSIEVNKNLISNNSMLVTGALSNSVSLANGNRGLSNGDTTTITGLISGFSSTQIFTSAGNFGSRTATLANYAGAMVADAAVQANSAKTKAAASTTAYEYLSSAMANLSGVNIDEETANLTVLQTNYQASAQLISTIKTLFDTLMRAVS